MTAARPEAAAALDESQVASPADQIRAITHHDDAALGHIATARPIRAKQCGYAVT